MPQKLKLTLEEKVKIVEKCISGKGSMTGSAKKYGVSIGTMRCWIRLYKARGIEGLMPASKTRKYSVEVKYQAVTEYLSGKGSMHEICEKYDISRRAMLMKWIKCYNSYQSTTCPMPLS